jgi:hypothetical protein
MLIIAVERSDPAKQLLMLHGRSSVGGGYGTVTTIFANKVYRLVHDGDTAFHSH